MHTKVSLNIHLHTFNKAYTAYNDLSMSLSFHSDQWNMVHTETGRYMSFKQVIRVYFNGMDRCHSFYYNDNFL